MTLRKIIFFLILILPAGTSRLLGQTQSQAAKIDQFLQAMQTKSNIPGFAVAVVTKDAVVFAKGYGTGADGQPVTSQTPFAIASLSKAFTAMSIMQLVAMQKVDLVAPAQKYVPTFKPDDPRSANITIDHLLHQTSGLNDKVFPELAFNEQPESLSGAISRMKSARLGSAPGSRFRYHNPNYQVLAKVTESVARQPFDNYMEQHIFKPLRMDNTKEAAFTKSFANTSPFFRNGHIFALGIPIAMQEPDWFVEGAAGMVSNAEDMSKWLRLQLNKGSLNGASLLDSAHLKAMHSRTSSSPYGMGWFADSAGNISHSGILWTYSSEQMVSANGYGIVMLFNGGINLFQDYHAFIQGVTDIMENKTATLPILPGWFYPLCTLLLMILSIGFAIRRSFRRGQWYENQLRRPAWRNWFYLTARMIPIVLLLCIPAILTAISGRVLNWKRIFLMAPDIITGLAIIALLNLVIVASRLALRYFAPKSAGRSGSA